MSDFSIADIIGKQIGGVSKLDTGEDMQQIGVDLLDANPMNFFEVEQDVTDLSESIKVNGLLQPLVVTPSDNGRYRVIAGHRRRAALLALHEQEPETYQTAPCKIVHPATPEAEELMLIQTNTSTREIGWSEKSKAAERTEAILIKMQQEQGVKLPGKMRENVAKLIKTSESQIARAKYIKKNLISDGKKLHLSDDCALKLAHLEPERQQEFVDHYKNESWKINASTLKQYRENVAEGKEPFYEAPPEPRTCYTYKTKKGGYRKCNLAPEKQKEIGCTYYCCSTCAKRVNCQSACSSVVDSMEKHKKTDAYLIGQRFRTAREKAGVSVSDIPPASRNEKNDDVKLFEDGLSSPTLLRAKALCTAVGLSLDALVGNPATGNVWLPLDAEHWPKEGQLVVLSCENSIGGYGYQIARCVAGSGDDCPFDNPNGNTTITDYTDYERWTPIEEERK